MASKKVLSNSIKFDMLLIHNNVTSEYVYNFLYVYNFFKGFLIKACQNNYFG